MPHLANRYTIIDVFVCFLAKADSFRIVEKGGELAPVVGDASLLANIATHSHSPSSSSCPVDDCPSASTGSFNTPRRLAIHLFTHFFIYMCCGCERVYKSKDTLRKHTQSPNSLCSKKCFIVQRGMSREAMQESERVVGVSESLIETAYRAVGEESCTPPPPLPSSSLPQASTLPIAPSPSTVVTPATPPNRSSADVVQTVPKVRLM
jgi:hypothetical protein